MALGESGSGKTETSKHIMNYIATISTQTRTKKASLAKRAMSPVQRQGVKESVVHIRSTLIHANPILEAFGNAETVKNDNSSRFGKYMVMKLSPSGQVKGGYIQNYLLEKSRVIRQAPHERSFHIFYYLLAGVCEEQQARWELLTPKEYQYITNATTESTSSRAQDQAKYAEILECMHHVGMTADEIRMVFQIIAAILWLGNIDMDVVEEGESNVESRAPKSNAENAGHAHSVEAMELTAELLGLELHDLSLMLRYRTLVVGRRSLGRSAHTIPLTTAEATVVRDTLAKSLYEKLFHWIVKKINAAIHVDDDDHHPEQDKSSYYGRSASSNTKCNTIGILDIYGFEIFETNGFEQLCINYVNERLQQLFISNTLQLEQQEYRKQKVGWKEITYFDNQIVCDLIDGGPVSSPGIFPLLDEQCMMSKMSTSTLIERYHHQFRDHAHYRLPKTGVPEFSVVHYAGVVGYEASNFLSANTDSLFNDLVDGIARSSQPFVQELFRDPTHELEHHQSKRPPSTSSQFRTQVQDLIQELNQCHPHYVRCIKPNDARQAMTIDRNPFRHQVEYLGLLENLRVRRSGYCYRETYHKFLQRFKMLSRKTWPHFSTSNSAKDAVLDLLSDPQVCIPPNDNDDDANDERPVAFVENSLESGCYALGKTKVFLRYPRGLFALENLRILAMPKMVGILERAYLRYRVRSKLMFMHQAYHELESKVRACDAQLFKLEARAWESKSRAFAHTRRHVHFVAWTSLATRLLGSATDNRWARALAQRESVIPIIWAQSYVRAKSHRRAFVALRHAANVFASHWKGLCVRRAMTPERWTQCRGATLGIRSEFERYMGQKKRRRDTLDRKYLGDYLSKDHDDLSPLFERIMDAHDQHHVTFAAKVIKINQRFKSQERIFLLTENFMFNIKANSKMDKLKERRCIPLDKISGVCMSTLPDNVLVIQIAGEYDFVFEIAEKIEVVHILREHFRRELKKELPIVFTNCIKYVAYPDVPHRIEFHKSEQQNEGLVKKKQSRRQLSITVGMKS